MTDLNPNEHFKLYSSIYVQTRHSNIQHLVSFIIISLVNVNIRHVTHTVQCWTPVVFRTAFKRSTFIFT